MRTFAGVGVLFATGLAAAACGGSHKTPHAVVSGGGPKMQTSVRTVTSSRLILGGRVRCTATARTPVQAGQRLGVVFTVSNVSRNAVKVSLAPWNVRVILEAGDGSRFDTQTIVPMSVPYIPPTRLAPGTTRTVRGLGALVRVRWRGSLRVTPLCERTRLPGLRVGVTAAGPPANGRTAVAAVVAASGHLFDHCLPEAAGVAVRGQIDAPDGSAPPLRATCSVSIRHEGRFWRARALVLSPPGLRYAQQFGPHQNAEEIVWEFVVTKNGAAPVEASERDASNSADRMATDWQWTGSKWEKAGDAHCGGFGSAGGGTAGPVIEFVTVCHS